MQGAGRSCVGIGSRRGPASDGAPLKEAGDDGIDLPLRLISIVSPKCEDVIARRGPCGADEARAIQKEDNMMEPWNKAYELEATAIAAEIIEEQGQLWLAGQMR